MHETHFYQWKVSTIFVSLCMSSHLVMCAERQRSDQWTSISHINYCTRTAASSRKCQLWQLTHFRLNWNSSMVTYKWQLWSGFRTLLPILCLYRVVQHCATNFILGNFFRVFSLRNSYKATYVYEMKLCIACTEYFFVKSHLLNFFFIVLFVTMVLWNTSCKKKCYKQNALRLKS